MRVGAVLARALAASALSGGAAFLPRKSGLQNQDLERFTA